MHSNVSKLALMVGLLTGVVALLVAGPAIVVGVRSVTADSDSGPVALQPSPAYSSSQGGISVTVDPPAPTESDYVKITVAGEMTCLLLTASHSMSGNSIYITVEGTPVPFICVDVVTPFSITEEIGQLPAGFYIVETTAHTQYCTPCVDMTAFQVQEGAEPTPTATPSPTQTATSNPAATATPIPMPTAAPTALPSVSVPMVTGWNARCYVGKENSIEGALGAVADKVVAVYILNSDQEFDRWVPGRPEVSTLATLKPYEQLFVLMSASATWVQQASVTEPPSIGLVQGWNSVCYAGGEKAVPEATSGIAGQFAVLYMLTGSQSWARFAPNRPDLSDISQLTTYDPILVLITQEGAEWAFQP